jgi:lipopolysaccharide transport system ATP-binding protein
MSDFAIRVENLSKAYRIGLKEQIPDTLVGALASWMRSPLRNFHNLRRLNTFHSNGDAEDIVWALKDVSFDVREGEVVGIIGRNGAGKSTLLKILSRITDPTSGGATIRGRVSSLLEVGTGFHPELTGRENIYMNGTILGMSKREIDRKFDEIVAFSGVEKFLDTPIKRYSSGMKVRLAFSVAAHLEPEILIIDEVLAVGDAEFQEKCLGKMEDVARGGRTVLFVSHNMPAVEALCTRGMELDAGRLVTDGHTLDVIDHYRRRAYARLERVENDARPSLDSRYIKEVLLLGPGGETTTFVPLGGTFHLRIVFHAGKTLTSPVIGLGIDDALGHRMLSIHSPVAAGGIDDVYGGCAVDCIGPEFPLAPGTYSVRLALAKGREPLDVLERALRLTVVDADLFGQGRGFHRGVCVARSQWLNVSRVTTPTSCCD